LTTIDNILEGKSGNYFKLEDDELADGFIIIESIDPKKTELRSEKVKNKDGGDVKDGKKETEYFHIGVRAGDAEKDLSMTFTALKQMAGQLPREENWRGYKLKFLGKKGSGKNIKYNFQVLGKETGEQAKLDQAEKALGPVDPAGRLLYILSHAPAGLTDKTFWEEVGRIVPSLGEAAGMVEKLKIEGKIAVIGGNWRKT